MKKIYIIGLLCAVSLGIFSCQDQKEDYIFEKNINARFQDQKDQLKKALKSPENGWVAYYAPNKGVGTYVLLFDFINDEEVKINSDYAKGKEDNTITYRIDKNLKPQLVFETTSVLHRIYETARNGVEGEYVFNIKSITEDEVVLESATDFGYNGASVTSLVLRKATPDQLDLSKINLITEVLENTGGLDLKNFVDRTGRIIKVEGTAISHRFAFIGDNIGQQINKYVIIAPEGEEQVKIPVNVTYSGFSLIEPYTINGVKVQHFKLENEPIRFVSNDGGQVTVIEGVEEPIPEEVKALEIIKERNSLFFTSKEFSRDYLGSLREVMPGYLGMTMYANYAITQRLIWNKLLISYKKADGGYDMAVADFEELIQGERTDVISFKNPGNANKGWAAIKEKGGKYNLYDFFFGESREFWIMPYKDGFVLYDRDHPEYWMYFR